MKKVLHFLLDTLEAIQQGAGIREQDYFKRTRENYPHAESEELLGAIAADMKDVDIWYIENPDVPKQDPRRIVGPFTKRRLSTILSFYNERQERVPESEKKPLKVYRLSITLDRMVQEQL